MNAFWKFSRIIRGFEEIRNKLLKEPATTAELMELVEYIDQARGQLLLWLKEDITEGTRMFFAIMDYTMMSAEDREMTVLAHTWHRKIQPAFEKSSIVSWELLFDKFPVVLLSSHDSKLFTKYLCHLSNGNAAGNVPLELLPSRTRKVFRIVRVFNANSAFFPFNSLLACCVTLLLNDVLMCLWYTAEVNCVSYAQMIEDKKVEFEEKLAEAIEQIKKDLKKTLRRVRDDFGRYGDYSQVGKYCDVS